MEIISNSSLSLKKEHGKGFVHNSPEDHTLVPSLSVAANMTFCITMLINIQSNITNSSKGKTVIYTWNLMHIHEKGKKAPRTSLFPSGASLLFASYGVRCETNKNKAANCHWHIALCNRDSLCRLICSTKRVVQSDHWLHPRPAICEANGKNDDHFGCFAGSQQKTLIDSPNRMLQDDSGFTLYDMLRKLHRWEMPGLRRIQSLRHTLNTLEAGCISGQRHLLCSQLDHFLCTKHRMAALHRKSRRGRLPLQPNLTQFPQELR